MRRDRLYTRYAFCATAKVLDSSGLETSAEVTNISVGGCRLITSTRFSVGVRVVIKIQAGSDYFEAPANIVHCTENGVGVMFHNESSKSFLVLNKWIQRAEITESLRDEPLMLRMSRRETDPMPKRILVVDDDTSVRTVVRKRIEHQLGFVCEEAENGLDAIAKEFKADLVVMDLAMPVMNGFEAAMVLQREMPEVPVVVLSIFAHEHFGATLANTFGVKAIIPKADGMSSLIECVQKILGS